MIRVRVMVMVRNRVRVRVNSLLERLFPIVPLRFPDWFRVRG